MIAPAPKAVRIASIASTGSPIPPPPVGTASVGASSSWIRMRCFTSMPALFCSRDIHCRNVFEVALARLIASPGLSAVAKSSMTGISEAW